MTCPCPDGCNGCELPLPDVLVQRLDDIASDDPVFAEVWNELKWCSTVDDHGSVDRTMGRLQEYFKNLPPIFDKHGGI